MYLMKFQKDRPAAHIRRQIFLLNLDQAQTQHFRRQITSSRSIWALENTLVVIPFYRIRMNRLNFEHSILYVIKPF